MHNKEQVIGQMNVTVEIVQALKKVQQQQQQNNRRMQS
jgi:hypothetical protein